MTQTFGVYATGGSIGPKSGAPYATYDDKEDAKAHAKRLRKQLTPGERKYYRMGYSVRGVPRQVN